MSEWREDRDAIRNMLRRVRLSELNDSGTQQTASISGLRGDKPSGVVRIQSYGLSSNPPEGSEGLALALGGRSDRLMVLGLESPEHRPRGLPLGATVLYDMHGQAVSLIERKLRIAGADSVEIACGSAAIKIEDGVITFTGSQIAMVKS